MNTHGLSVIAGLLSLASGVDAARQATTIPGRPTPTLPSATDRPVKLGNHSGLDIPALAEFGSSVVALGDLDDDGRQDIAVGSPLEGQGRVRILFLNSSFLVLSAAEIPGEFFGPFETETFGYSLCALDDLDGNGVEDLVVGDPYTCRVWILFLRTDGTIRDWSRISDALPPPSFPGLVELLGQGVASIGDVDADGVGDLVVMQGRGPEGDDGGYYVVFLHANGTVKGWSWNSGAFPRLSGLLSCAALSDLDGDGIREVALGDSYNVNRIAIVFLDANGVAREETEFTEFPGFGTTGYGFSVAGVHDVDGNGVEDLVVGSPGRWNRRGSYWLTNLDAQGGVIASVEIRGPAGHQGWLSPGDGFGSALAFLGDPDGDGDQEIAVGASGDDDGEPRSGAVWVLELP
jgi:FG-GAP repeat protein